MDFEREMKWQPKMPGSKSDYRDFEDDHGFVLSCCLAIAVFCLVIVFFDFVLFVVIGKSLMYLGLCLLDWR